MLKKFRTFVTLLLVLGLSAVLMGDAAENYPIFSRDTRKLLGLRRPRWKRINASCR